MRIALAATLMIANACSGVALNTRVAETPSSRAAIAASVIPGKTTEMALITRWGHPTQKVRDGAQTEFIYRNMWNPPDAFPLPNYGDSENYVIVTFQYGIATGVRISDEIACRGTFAPRPPNYTFDNPTEVRLAGECAPDYGPTAFQRMVRAARDGTAAVPADTAPPTVMSDDYVPGGKAGGKAGGI